MRCGQLFGDLESGVAATHDEDGSVGDIVGCAVLGAVGLEHVRRKPARELRDERHLKWPGRDHDLIGRDRPAVQLKEKAPLFGAESPRPAVELDRKVERLRVLLQIRNHLIAGWVALRIARKGQPRQAAVPPRREESERLPTSAPSNANRVGRVEDHKPPSLTPQEVTHSQTRLPRSDHNHFEARTSLRRHGRVGRGLAHRLAHPHRGEFFTSSATLLVEAGLNEKALNWAGALLLIGRQARVPAYFLIRCPRQEASAGRAVAVASARQGQSERCFPR